MKRFIIPIATAMLSALSTTTPAGVTGQWDFNTGNLNATVGTALSYRGNTAATTTFTTATIGGISAAVMGYPGTTPAQGYIMAHGITPNGGGTMVNQYTLIMDVMFPAASSGQWRVFLQSDTTNTSDGELFVNPANGIGISGLYHGKILADTWHRVAFVVDLTLPAQRLRKFIDGALVGTQDLDQVDGRWALSPTALLFTDDDNETRAGFVNCIQIRSEAIADVEVAALGGPTATGIPLPVAPTSLHLVNPNGGQSYQAGTAQNISWIVSNPSGLVQIDLLRNGTLFRSLGQASLSQSNFFWTIDPYLGDSNNYRIKLTSVTYPAASDASDADFSVFGSAPTPNPVFGQPLQANGGFELRFANWQTTAGNPLVLNSAGTKGSPHGGTNFLHGGINTAASNTTVRQDIDLIAAGFTTNDIDAGAALAAEAWLRNFYGAGTFDDQVFYRIGYLDGGDQEISAVRCLIAANNAWLQRSLTGLLPAGTRKLRLEVIGKHRRDADNDSMADDLIVPVQKPVNFPTPAITKLPMLQDVRTETMTMIWETDGNLARHYVDWGRTNIAEHTLGAIDTLQIDATHFVHRASIPGLETETSYVYRVRS